MLKSKGHIITSVVKDVKKLEPSFIAGAIIKRYNCFGKQLGKSSKVKHRFFIRFSNSTPRHIGKRN